MDRYGGGKSRGLGMICKGREKKRDYMKKLILDASPSLVSDSPFRLMLWSGAQLGIVDICM